MTVLYYDCFAGISGDMNLGALVDLGVDQNYLINTLNKLSIRDEFKLEVNKKQKMGIEGTKVDVILDNEHEHQHDHEHKHKHKHDHEHQHEHKDEHKHQHEHNHEHRNLESIRRIINEATFNDNIKKISLNMFMEVAKAEAKVHGKSIEEVHFHEVGAVDSIVDIVGAAICLDYLKVDKVMASTVELGGGFVRCAHGTIPVPAPATVEILKNVPVHIGKVDFETTTPTGAAILKSTVSEFSDNIDFNIIKTGYGLGTKDFNIPNVVRVFLGEEVHSNKTKLITEKQIMIEVNIDDMNPELYSFIENKLFENGALDVYKTNIIMKKGRPAVKLSVLVDNDNLDIIEEILFTETSTLGIREYEIEKKMLSREFDKINTKYGEISIKKGLLNNEVIKTKPEYEDCKAIAEKYNIPIKDVYKEILKCECKEA
ncbi:MAG: nickel pincer cofactor biosynthesis protein LarC [Vallitalea sp.]|nr:nickel pincer cofactor biosynthesis protein LarC [Vallitalea sp.]